MVQIKQEFQRMYGKTLDSFIAVSIVYLFVCIFLFTSPHRGGGGLVVLLILALVSPLYSGFKHELSLNFSLCSLILWSVNKSWCLN